MVSSYESAHSSLSEYVANVPELGRDLNEATTRLRLIDRLLFEWLGWEPEDCKAEDRFDGTITDYSMFLGGCQLIVEAKKVGTSFSLPAGFALDTCKISYFKENCADVYAAITQATAYCQTRGVPIGVVANGNQIIAFLGQQYT